jgi:hypothetical protein
MTTVGKRLAILAAVAALGAAGCGSGSSDSPGTGGATQPAAKTQSTDGVPVGSAAGDPDCQSKKDPATGRYLPTPEKCHLGK